MTMINLLGTSSFVHYEPISGSCEGFVPILPIFLSNSELVCDRTGKFREFLHELTKILGNKRKIWI